jgi:hypothetical protein
VALTHSRQAAEGFPPIHAIVCHRWVWRRRCGPPVACATRWGTHFRPRRNIPAKKSARAHSTRRHRGCNAAALKVQHISTATARRPAAASRSGMAATKAFWHADAGPRTRKTATAAQQVLTAAARSTPQLRPLQQCSTWSSTGQASRIFRAGMLLPMDSRQATMVRRHLAPSRRSTSSFTILESAASAAEPGL